MATKLKIPLKKFGALLISRPAAREAFQAFMAYGSTNPFEIFSLDFSGVEVLAPSWLDEFTHLLKEKGHDVLFEPSRNASVVQSLKTIHEAELTRAKKHPWRLCNPGFHWVQIHSRKNKSGTRSQVQAHCQANESHKDTLYPEEIARMVHDHFGSISLTINPDPLGFLKPYRGDSYDRLIDGWTRYWNDIFGPSERLNPNLVKALMATESSFNPHPGNSRIKAVGLLQLMPETIHILGDIRGELPNHLVRIDRRSALDPACNIAAGIRWLFWKKQRASARLAREASWREAVLAYKNYLGKKPPKGKPGFPIMMELDRYLAVLSK